MELSMTPMIDVVFLLLIFFISTASFEIIEQLLPSGISELGQVAGQAAQAKPPESSRDINDCIARLIHDPGAPDSLRFQFNNRDVPDRQTLLKQMAGVITVQSDIPIVVHPDDQVPIGEAIEIYDRARAFGGQQVYFATH
jgi:biopolymer transport protein ExbD